MLVAETEPGSPVERNQPPRPRRLKLLLCLLLIGLPIVLVFGQVARFQFLDWDDPVNITRNPLLKPPSWHSAFAFWLAPYAGLYVPITYDFWSLEAWISSRHSERLGALSPAIFHLGNLLLHLLATLALFGLLRSLRLPDAAAAAGALLFALHPLQAESVAWVTETKGLLCGLFSFLALWAYTRFANPQSGAVAARRLWYIAATLGCVLALLSKPSAMVLPAMAMTIDVALLGRRWQRSLIALLPWWVFAAGPMLITKRLQPDELLAQVPSLPQRVLVAFDSLQFYLVKCICPLHLGPDYGRTPQMALTSSGPYIGIALFAAVFVLLAVVRSRWLTAAALLFAVALAPVLGLVPFAYQQFSTVADRYAYLALLGPALGLAWCLARFARPAAWCAVAPLILVLAAQSYRQTACWQANDPLFRHALRVNPNSLLAHNGLGNILANEHRWSEALAEYQAAVDADSLSSSAHYNLGRTLAQLGESQRAITELNRALELRPGYEKAHYELARIFAAQKNWRSAREQLTYVTAIDPQRSDAWFYLGEVAIRLSQPNEAIRCFEQAAKLAPANAETRQRLALVYYDQGRIADARTACREALRLNQNLPESRELLRRLGGQ